MGHDFGVGPRFLSVTPSRDNVRAPGNRLKDKHSRLFCGKTLDEWLMIQLWSSKYLGAAAFVIETDEQYDRLWPLADKYGVELLVRPEQMLAPMNDTGGVPLTWGIKQMLARDYWSLVMTPFVVAPCRPPGFFDYMVDEYLRLFGNPDYEKTQMWAMGLYDFDGAAFEIDDTDVASQLGAEKYLNKNPRFRIGTTQHFIAWTYWYVEFITITASRHDLSLCPKIFDIEPWMDIHIDEQGHWDDAEYYFKKNILSQGEDCYERYRDRWVAASKEAHHRHHGQEAVQDHRE